MIRGERALPGETIDERFARFSKVHSRLILWKTANKSWPEEKQIRFFKLRETYRKQALAMGIIEEVYYE